MINCLACKHSKEHTRKTVCKINNKTIDRNIIMQVDKLPTWCPGFVEKEMNTKWGKHAD